LFIADEDERNELDHRKIEDAIFEVADMVCVKRSFGEIARDIESGACALIEPPPGSDSNPVSELPKLIYKQGVPPLAHQASSTVI